MPDISLALRDNEQDRKVTLLSDSKYFQSGRTGEFFKNYSGNFYS